MLHIVVKRNRIQVYQLVAVRIFSWFQRLLASKAWLFFFFKIHIFSGWKFFCKQLFQIWRAHLWFLRRLFLNNLLSNWWNIPNLIGLRRVWVDDHVSRKDSDVKTLATRENGIVLLQVIVVKWSNLGCFYHVVCV